MDLAIQANSYTSLSPMQNRASPALSLVQPVAAPKPETSTRTTQEDVNLSQTQQQRPAQNPAQASNLVSRMVTDYEYEGALSVMKVTDKDVLIYQVPAKGALEIIKAEADDAARIQATA